MKRQNVVDGNWDYLLVLDAARYDTFASIYDEYVKGDLQKRESRGSATPEWAAKTFRGYHDITYFSANPFINSLGIPLDRMDWGASFASSWTSTDHIGTIHDLWEKVWDDDLGTVRPSAVNEYVRDHRDELEAADQSIIHYMQPHAPFLINGKGRKVNTIRKSFEEAKVEGAGAGNNGILSTILDPAKPHVERVLERSELAMKLGMLVELTGSSIFDIWADGAKETLQRYYEENLRIGLEAAAELAENLDGRVVITSDHGEAFGEQGIWEHHVETHIPPLIEVPWLVVDSVRR